MSPATGNERNLIDRAASGPLGPPSAVRPPVAIAPRLSPEPLAALRVRERSAAGRCAPDARGPAASSLDRRRAGVSSTPHDARTQASARTLEDQRAP